MKLKKFKMSEFMACAAKSRPDYCKYDTNFCCFGCEYNTECMEHALKNRLMRPCTSDVFEESEVCEFSL
jgi:hypothetical protein